MTNYPGGMVAAILFLALVGPPARGQDSLLMTCAQHGTGAMTLKFVRQAGAGNRNVAVIGQTSNRKWTVKINGNDVTPPTQTLNSPGVVAVQPTDSITFKVENPRHGILFLSEELARGFLDFEAAGETLDDRPPKGEFDWGTEKFDGPNDFLAVAKVRDGSASAPGTTEEKFFAGMTPSMQRRLLRFVNRAYTPDCIGSA